MKFILAPVIAIFLAGCAAGIKGRSDSPEYLASSTSYYAAEIKSALEEASSFKKEYTDARSAENVAADLDILKLARNDFALKMLEAHELSLQDYARSLSVEGRGGKFAGDLAAIGLTAASTIISNSGTQSILSGAATALLGIEQGYSKELLLDQTVDFVLIQMAAKHLESRRKIVANLAKPVAEYPLTAVELDLRGVARATTFEVALSDIKGKAQENLNTATNRDDSSIEVKFDEKAAKELEAIICDDAKCTKLKPDAQAAALMCISERQELKGLLLVDFLDARLTDKRKILIECLASKNVN